MSTFDTSKIVVLPVPYEHTVSYGGGTRNGPRAILDAAHYVEHYDEEFGTGLCRSVGIATLPPHALGKRTDENAVRQIYDSVEELIARDKFVVVLGGEHTVSQAPIRTHLAKYPELSVVHIDAHADLRDTYEGTAYSHACIITRLAWCRSASAPSRAKRRSSFVTRGSRHSTPT